MNDIELPFLLEHGAWFWKVLLVAVAPLPLALAWVVSRVLASRRRRRAVDALLRDRHAIRGVLRGRDPGQPVAITVKVERAIAAPEVVRWTAGDLWLETPDRTIAIEGTLDVAIGSGFRARHGVLPLPAEVSDLVAKASGSPKTPPTVTSARTLVAGDEIVLCGEPVPQPGSKETGHRTADIAWRIGGEQPLPSAAHAGALPRVRFRVVTVLALVALGGVIGHQVERNRAKAWHAECEARYPRPISARVAQPSAPIELDNANVCVRAASLGSSTSLETLFEYGLDRGGTDAERAPVLALGRLVIEDCQTRVMQYMHASRYDDVVREARFCGDPDREYEALVALARFDEAADVLPRVTRDTHRSELEIAVLVAAERWADAARAVEQSGGERAACLAALFRHHAGEPDALGKLRVRVEAEARTADDKGPCQAMLAEVDPEVRRAWVASPGRAPWALRIAAGVPDLYANDGPEKLLQAHNPIWDAALAWLPIETPDDRARLQQARWQAVSRLIHDDLDGAMASAREAVAILARLEIAPEDRYAFRHVDVLPSVVAFYGSSTDLPARPPPPDPSNENVWRTDWLLSFGRLLVRAGQPLAELEYSPVAAIHPALEAARRGDAGPLITYLLDQRYFDPLDVLAVAPFVDQGRADLAAVVSRMAAVPSYLPPDLPTAAILTFRHYAMLKAVGATEAAARQHAQFARYDAVLRDRRRLVALVLLRD